MVLVDLPIYIGVRTVDVAFIGGDGVLFRLVVRRGGGLRRGDLLTEGREAMKAEDENDRPRKETHGCHPLVAVHVDTYPMYQWPAALFIRICRQPHALFI